MRLAFVLLLLLAVTNGERLDRNVRDDGDSSPDLSTGELSLLKKLLKRKLEEKIQEEERNEDLEKDWKDDFEDKREMEEKKIEIQEGYKKEEQIREEKKGFLDAADIDLLKPILHRIINKGAKDGEKREDTEKENKKEERADFDSLKKRENERQEEKKGFLDSADIDLLKPILHRIINKGAKGGERREDTGKENKKEERDDFDSLKKRENERQEEKKGFLDSADIDLLKPILHRIINKGAKGGERREDTGKENKKEERDDFDSLKKRENERQEEKKGFLDSADIDLLKPILHRIINKGAKGGERREDTGKENKKEERDDFDSLKKREEGTRNVEENEKKATLNERSIALLSAILHFKTDKDEEREEGEKGNVEKREDTADIEAETESVEKKEETRDEQGDEKLRGLIRRVIGGEVIDEGVWPWLVSLQGDLPRSKIFGITVSAIDTYCGASLIANQWILTAAHCFDPPARLPGKYKSESKDPSNYEARVADVELESSWWDKIVGVAGKVLDKDDWKIKDWEIKGDKIFIHPDYNPDKKWMNDIALMKLKERLPDQPDFIEEIQRIPLAQDSSFPRANQDCVFKGWGCTRSGGRVSSVARQATFPVIDNESCSDLWHIDTVTRLCAGYLQANRGICPGDSGGPLVCRSGDKWIQVGVASFTASDHPGQFPGAFTRVSNYVPWIKDVISKN